ncbi:MAG TPA: DUF4136 domain-containing protein [Steroidobacteraceae bacterium]|nr:DUF4136 domain-containing protein [Steroidobacteraceae bacterium]
MSKLTVAGLALGLGATLLAGCAAPVRSDYDSHVGMSACHNYAWLESPRAESRRAQAFDNPLNTKRLRDAVQANLAEHGLQPVAEGAAADCTVAYAIGSRQRLDDGYPRVGWGFGFGWGSRRSFGSLAWDDDVYAYREGRISVDIYNARNNEPIWHASVDEDVTYLTGSDAEARIGSAVKALFSKFPPAART